MTSPLEKLLIGRSLVGRYEVEELIGRGGMSLVYRADDTRLGRPVALKVISVPSELDESQQGRLRERLRREAGAAAKLSAHPNVVQIYDYGTDAELDLDFIAMELLSGSDLKRAMMEDQMDGENGLRILLSAADGVAAGHRAGIVHRDLKPANIFLADSGHRADPPVVKILDFGIAKALDPGADEDLTHLEQSPQSPAYASPEQLAQGARIDAASDVYQLGLVAYELLAGARPFDDADRARIRAGEAVPLPERGNWSEVAAAIRDVVERALHPEPERRFADAIEFGDALRGATGDTTLHLEQPVPDVPAAYPASDETQLLGEPPATAQRTMQLPTRPIALGALGIGALVLILWLGDGEESAPEELDDVPVAEAGVEQLDEEFAPLVMEAFQRLQEAVSAEEGEEAAQAVQAAIYEVQAALVEGDLDRLVSNYAEEAEIEGDMADRDQVREDRASLIERFPSREIMVPRLAIEFVAPGRARALVDREWTYASNDEEETGSGRTEMILEKRDDQWLIVAERELEQFE